MQGAVTQQDRGSCPSWSSSGEMEGVLCPPLPCCFTLKLAAVSPLQGRRSAPKVSSHVWLWQNLISKRPEHPERDAETELGAGNSQSLSFQDPSLEVFSHARHTSVSHIRTDLKSSKFKQKA